MKIRNLDTFYWIANLGSFRAAAQKLNLTQPAVTARIQVLEQDVGAEVFVRDTRSAELTPAGRKLLPYAEKALELDSAIVTAFSDTATVEQSVRLGASETIVSSWLPDFLTDYSKTRPRLTFDLTVDSSNHLRNALVSREIDLAFLMGPIAEASITNLDLCEYEMVLAAAPSLAERLDFWSSAAIAAETIVTFSANTRPHNQIREALAPLTHGQPKITGSASLGAVVRLGCAGYGLCALPRSIIRREIATGALVELKTDLEISPIAFTASYVSGAVTSSLAEDISAAALAYLA
ncbi:LysR family transcriptional regulator [Roseibium sp. TrichSKD4]|nr:LysR family transcriptional regulator [Roseibium sp. TrichSKD4]EFO30253.1 LysR family transcriptional regulator [Roseibium sp. TrichSKD4]